MGLHARLATAAVMIVGLCAAVPAQQPPVQQPPAQQPPARPPSTPQTPPQGPPVIRSGINFVSVDVIVTDKKSGEVVLDMKQDDFEVREDKKPQQVQTFDVVKIDPLTAEGPAPRAIRSTYDEESEARQPNVRLFVIFLDDYHVRRGNDLAVRRPLIDFVQNQLAPQDMVAIMYPLTPVTALTFTRDHGSLISAINKFEGRKGVYEPRNEFEERYAYYPAATVERIRDDVTLTAVSGAAVKLGGMREGRKTIVFVSEGFTATLPPQLNDPIAALPGIGNRAQPGAQANDPRADSQNFFNQMDLTSRLRETYETVNRNNTSIYAVDPRGLAAFEYDVNQGVALQTDRQNLTATIDTLYVLANNTDGRAIVNRNDLAAGMKQIIRDASGYYLLGYTSASAPTDGKFHTIDVRVKRPGVEIRARKGYWAYTADDAARATAPPKPGPPPAVSNALNSIVEPTHGGHAARFWTGTDRGPDGQTRVAFAWEPLAAQENARPGDAAARVVLTATAADGHPVFRGRVPDDAAGGAAPDAGAAPAASTTVSATKPAAAASVAFSAPPGAVELRIIVENAQGRVIDSTSETLTLPDYAQTQVSLSTPRVYRARTAREMLQLRNNPDAPPIVTREFSRAERLLIRFDAYAAGGTPPEVTARLLNRAGQPMADVPIQATEGKPLVIDFPLASLAAGEYILELNAKAPSGTAQQMIGFRIGG
ncbi:MAG TPA: VWA domain-containing protein [Vicinamibacterales bacterium]|nr:VWA domain-containing protein [Vicinamibacterales bacterium]